MGYQCYRQFGSVGTNSKEDLELLTSWLEANGSDYPDAVLDPDWHKWYKCHTELLAFSEAHPDVTIWMDEQGEDDHWILVRFKAGQSVNVNRILPLKAAEELVGRAVSQSMFRD